MEILEINKNGFEGKEYVVAIHECNEKFYGIKLVHVFSVDYSGYISFSESIAYDIENLKNKTVNYIGLSENGNGNLTLPGLVQITPKNIQGCDLGSYCMSYAVKWAKEHYPSAKIEDVILHNLGVDNVERRNGFYIRCGLKIIPDTNVVQETTTIPNRVEYGRAIGNVMDLLIPKLREGLLMEIPREQVFELIMQSKENTEEFMNVLNSCLEFAEWLSCDLKREWITMIDIASAESKSFDSF
jgi:hypothetical protein